MQNVIFTESRCETRKPRRSIVCFADAFREVSLDETYFHEMEFMASVRSSFSESCISWLKMNSKWNMYIRPFRVRAIASIKRFVCKIIDREGWWIISYTIWLFACQSDLVFLSYNPNVISCNVSLIVPYWMLIIESVNRRRSHKIRKCSEILYLKLLNLFQLSSSELLLL